MSLNKMVKGIKHAEKLLVTPIVVDFMRRHPDGVIWDDDGYALWKTLTTKAMGNEDRGGRFGSSSRGTCKRRQVFTFLRMPSVQIIPFELLNVFNDGKWRHLRWQMMCLQSGALTHAEWPYKLDSYNLSGSMDGYNERENFGFELKGDRNSSRLMDGVPEAHMLQIHTMMLATDIDTFCYLVEDKATNEWREIIVRRNPKVIAEVRAELDELNEAILTETLPEVLTPCLVKMGPYRSCPFNTKCLERNARGNDWPTERSWE